MLYTNKMEALIQLLRNFEDDKTEVHDMDDFVMNKEVEEAACCLLIDSDGNCNWSNISVLKTAGFNVIPVERDRFGWLVGGIITKNGIITYG